MQLLLLTCLLQLIMVTNKAIASQISQIKHFFHCILVVVCPNSSMYLIMSGSSRPLPTVLVNSKGIGKHLLKLEVGHIQSAVGGGVVGGKSRTRGIPVPQHVQIEIV